jgi:hypothetical protein
MVLHDAWKQFRRLERELLNIRQPDVGSGRPQALSFGEQNYENQLNLCLELLVAYILHKVMLGPPSRVPEGPPTSNCWNVGSRHMICAWDILLVICPAWSSK